MYIIIPDVPVPQKRHRTADRGRRTIYYDPNAREKAWTRMVLQNYLREHYPDFEMFKHPRVSFIFHMPIPSYFSRKLKQLAKVGLLKHEKKPDYDNLSKFILDCMTGVLFEDDCLVSCGPSIKLYHEFPKTIIHVEETSQTLQPWELAQYIYNPERDYAALHKCCDGATSFPRDLKDHFPRPSSLCRDTIDPPVATHAALLELLALWDKVQCEYHREGVGSHMEPDPPAGQPSSFPEGAP